MKKHSITLIILLLSSFSFFAQQVQNIALSASDSKIELIASSLNQLSLTSTMNEIDVKTIAVPGNGIFSALEVEGMTFSSTIGLPRLPVHSKLIEVPYGAQIQVVVNSFDEEVIDLDQLGLGKIVPAQPSYSKSTDPSDYIFQKDNKYYSTNSFDKTPLVRTEIYGKMRGVRIGRVEVCPYHYNPVENKLIVYNNLDFEIQFVGADHAATEAMKTKYFSADFEPSYNMLMNYQPPASKDAFSDYSAPLKYVIVADRIQENTLNPFVAWKKKSGYNVIEAYTDVIGSTSTAITAYLQGLYDNATASDPAPLYVLIIGDHGDIPGHSSQTSSHITDLYYATYDGGSDYLPDVYYGRISAETTVELKNALDKILPYEEYTIPDGTYLNNCMLIAGVDGSYAPTHGDATILYGINEYFNTAHNLTNIYAYYHTYTSGPYHVMSSASSSAAGDIKSKISAGIGFANYTAHCDHDGWSDPAVRRSDIANFNNVNEYPFMIGNCCLSFEFNQSDAFGEMLLYGANEGAVGYIGTSNYSYWDEDVYWGIGLTSISISQANVPNHNYGNTGLGVYDGVYHENGEPYSDWYYTGRQMVHMGNTAVQASTSSRKQYYWEIYHCVGDPSLMPYMYEPPALSLTYTAPSVGATSLDVTTEPYTYVAISQDGNLLDAKWSGSGTTVTLAFTSINGNDLTIVGTKQNRSPYVIEDLVPINVTTPPTADFIADQTVVTVGTTINFTDLSTDYPATWSWSFPGGTPSSSTDQNPSIDYNTAGTYDVTLYVTNGAGNDTELKTGYITVNPISNPPVVDFVASNTTINVGQTIDFTDLSTNLPSSWAWTFEGGTPNTSIDQNPVGIQYNTPGTYFVTLDATNGVGTGTLTKNLYILVEVPDPCAASATNTSYEHISNVNVGTIDNGSGSSGYADYRSMSTDMLIGTGYPITITVGGTGYSTDQALIWVDWNKDGDFYDAGEDVFTSANGSGPFTATITPQTGTPLGACTMRIRLHDTANGPNTDPCGNSTYGEVEDYTINVLAVSAPPTASFTANETSTCTGAISFTDGSSGADSWSWDFGDGNNSSLPSPVHTYATSGTFTVSLTVTNAFGTDTHVETNLITVALPTAPIATDASRCDEGSVTLTATGTGSLEWYDAPTGGTLVNSGGTFTTPSLTTTTTYYIEDHIPNPQTYGIGETNNTSGGGFFTATSQHGLIFDCTTAFTLVSVEVNANSAGDRTIELRDASDAVLQTATINIPSGVSRIDLNFNVPVGTGLKLMGPASPNLYRNNAGGLAYPYELPGIVSIHYNTANDYNYYYYYYDWEISVAEDCISSRTPSIATIETPVAVSLNVSTANTSICLGDNVTFTASGNGGGTTPSYDWQINGSSVQTGTGTTYSTTSLSDGDVVTCELSSSEACNDGPASSNNLIMTVNPAANPSISIVATNTSICAGDNVTFTPTVVDEGTTPTYDWQINGSSVATGASFSSTALADGDMVTCLLTSSEPCASGAVTSNTVTMSVGSIVNVDVSILSDLGTAICTGETTTFTATPTNAGALPSYQWYLNSAPVGTGGTTYINSTLADGDIVSCELNSSETCANNNPAPSNNITMVVSSTLTPTITISESSNTICVGENVSFTSTVTGEGSTPVYEWFVNSSSVGTASTFSSSTLSDGDVVTCELTSSSSCATISQVTSTPVTMNVSSSVTPTVSITASSAVICAGDNVDFTPTVAGEGSTPTYEWFVNSSSVGTASTFSSSSLNDGDIVSCSLTSSLACATVSTVNSNNVTVSVTAPQNVSVSIAANTGTAICAGDMVAFTATGINEGNSPQYDWLVNGSSVGSTSSYSTSSLSDGDIVSCILTSSETCVIAANANSNILSFVVEESPTADYYYSTSGPVVTLLDNSSNATSYLWDFGDNNTSTIPSPTHTYSANGIYTVTLIATNNCGSDTVSYDINILGVSVASQKLSDIEMYPNPTNGILTIELNNNPVDKLELYDVIGKCHITLDVVYERTTLDMRRFDQGMYFVRLYNGKDYSVSKVILSK